LFIGIWLAAGALSTFVSVRMAGYLNKITYSRAGRTWQCWISFLLFIAQVLGDKPVAQQLLKLRFFPGFLKRGVGAEMSKCTNPKCINNLIHYK
jgi:hypothetical protein